MAEDMFVNPVLHALATRQRRFAQFAGNAWKYETDVAPFAAVAEREAGAMRDLCSLLAPGETVYMMGAEPLVVPGLAFQSTLAGVQMIYPNDAVLRVGIPSADVVKLSRENAAEMVALTEVAFPGYFRIRTC